MGLLKNLDLDQWSMSCPNLKAQKYAKLTAKIDKILNQYISLQLTKKSPKLIVAKLQKYRLALSKYSTKDLFKKQIIDYLTYKFQNYIYALSRNKLLPPSQGIYFGAFQFFGNSENQVSTSQLTRFQQLI